MSKNAYIGIYRGRQAECHADTKYAAQQELAKILKAGFGPRPTQQLITKAFTSSLFLERTVL